MCLSIPGKVLEITDDTARVDVGGVMIDCNMMLLRDAGIAVGDYVLVHTGFAIQKYDLEEAQEILELLSRVKLR
jgi:hydrogenase expression/formation protein HypC